MKNPISTIIKIASVAIFIALIVGAYFFLQFLPPFLLKISNSAYWSISLVLLMIFIVTYWIVLTADRASVRNSEPLKTAVIVLFMAIIVTSVLPLLREDLLACRGAGGTRVFPATKLGHTRCYDASGAEIKNFREIPRPESEDQAIGPR